MNNSSKLERGRITFNDKKASIDFGGVNFDNQDFSSYNDGCVDHTN